ncbi:MAG: adenylate/guanylate cyclase domain-containing protein [Actinomycetota bacterium]|nr:adenylate/guanylate cyclase domain-containing protein [Actinomycetota bacterium]
MTKSLRSNRPIGSWARVGIWLLHLSLPMLGLWLLIAAPRIDGRWEHHAAHLWLVAGVAAACTWLAVRVRSAAARHRDARLMLVALAFATAAGFLFLHALSTPKVLAHANYGFVAAAPAGLFIASLFAAASALEWRGRGADAVLRWQRLAWWALLVVFVCWAAASLAEVGPFGRSVTPSEAHGPLVLVAVGGGLMYAGACLAYWRVYRRRPAAMLLGVLTGFALLAEALAAVAYGRNWQASWWEWHLLMGAGFAYIVYSARVQYRREGAAHPALFAAVGLDETSERIRREYGSSLEAMVEALRRRIDGTEASGPVADQVVARFSLTEGQAQVLEQAADSLVQEREEVHRLGELVAMGQEATVAAEELEFLSRAIDHAGEAFRRCTVGLALLESGRLRCPPELTTGPDRDQARTLLEGSTGLDVVETREPVVHGADGAWTLAVPIVMRGQPAAVLAVRQPGPFGGRDRAVVLSFAAQLSVSLENERLYHQIDVLFRQYMAPDIVTAILADPSQAELGGAVVEVTSLFADLRGFTSFSERSEPAVVVDLLNRYFGAAVPAVLDHGGTVTQFAGDNIMAVWNAPTRQPDHALRAARAGLALQQTVQDLGPTAEDAPQFRVGINTGPALVGNVGAAVRCYTANGDSVNLAARFEGLARPGGVVIGEATLRAIGDTAIVEDLGDLTVKGKDQPVRAYALLGLRD